MKKIAALLALSLLLASLLVPPSAAGQTPPPSTPSQATSQPAGTPAGRTVSILVSVENGTPGGEVPADVALTLYAVGQNGPVYTRQARSDASGQARFADLEHQELWRFAVVGQVGATTYFSQMVAPDTGAPTAGGADLRIPLRVYDTTTDTSHVRISRAYLAVEAVADGQLQVTSMYLLANDGDRTIEAAASPAGGPPGTLHFPLPRDAQNVQFEQDNGSRYGRTDYGFVTSDSVVPGDQSDRVAVRYTVAYSDVLRLDNTLAYPVDGLAVYIATEGITLANSLMTGPETQAGENGGKVSVWTAEKVAANQPLTLEFNGKPNLPSPLPPVAARPQTEGLGGLARGLGLTTEQLAGLGAIALGLLTGLVALAVSMYYRLRRPDVERDRQRALVRALVDLQEDRSAGRIAPADYEQRRARLVAALSMLIANAAAAGD